MVSSAKYQQINERRYPVTEYQVRFPSQESNRAKTSLFMKMYPICAQTFIHAEFNEYIQ